MVNHILKQKQTRRRIGTKMVRIWLRCSSRARKIEIPLKAQKYHTNFQLAMFAQWCQILSLFSCGSMFTWWLQKNLIWTEIIFLLFPACAEMYINSWCYLWSYYCNETLCNRWNPTHWRTNRKGSWNCCLLNSLK